MTINVKVTVPETAKWRARVVLQDRAKDDQHEWGAYADASFTTIEPGSASDFAATDSRRIVVEEIPLAAAEEKSADAEADEADQDKSGSSSSGVGIHQNPSLRKSLSKVDRSTP